MVLDNLTGKNALHSVSMLLNFNRIILIIVIIGNIYGMIAYGATFWVDSMLYVDMGYKWVIQGNLSSFYQPLIKCIAPHFPALPSLLWGLSYKFLGNYSWIGYVTVQRLIAGFSLYFFVISLKKYVNKNALIFAVLFLTFFPYYQSIHNMIMTESIASSSLVVIIACFINIYAHKEKTLIHNDCILLLFTFIGIQARPQVILYTLIFSSILYLLKKLVLNKLLLIYLFCIISYIIFPIYRYYVAGEFFLPNLKCLSVRSALMPYLNKETSVNEIIRNTDPPNQIIRDTIMSTGLSYSDSSLWYSSYNNDSKERSGYARLANQIKYANLEGITSQIDTALSGIGIINIHFFHTKNEILSEGMSASDWSKLYNYHYRWLSWTSDDNYGARFSDFINRFYDQNWYSPESILIFSSSLSPYISTYPVMLRDPLFLSKISPDFWSIIVIIILLLIILKIRINIIFYTWVILSMISFGTVFLVGFGNIRYFYIIMPIQVMGTSFVIYWFYQFSIRYFKGKRN